MQTDSKIGAGRESNSHSKFIVSSKYVHISADILKAAHANKTKDSLSVLASTHELKRFLTVKRALCIVPGQKFTGEQGRSIWTIN